MARVRSRVIVNSPTVYIYKSRYTFLDIFLLAKIKEDTRLANRTVTLNLRQIYTVYCDVRDTIQMEVNYFRFPYNYWNETLEGSK